MNARAPAFVPFVAIAFLCASPAPARARPPTDPGAVAVMRRSDSLFTAFHADAAMRVLDPLLAEARRRRDRNLEMEIVLRRAAALGTTGHSTQSEVEARAGLAIAEALHDSVCIRIGTRWLAFSYLNRMRMDQAIPLYRRLLALAVPAGAVRDEGFARTAIAYGDLLAGRFEQAREGYTRAIACLRKAGDARSAMSPMVGLARVQAALADYAGVRASYQSIIQAARATHNRSAEGDAWNNLGVLEYEVGDPSVAVGYWERAIRLYRESEGTEGLHSSATNIAVAEADLGRFDDASARLERLYRESEQVDDTRGQRQILIQLAEVRRAQGRYDEAIRYDRQCLAMRAEFAPSFAVESAEGLSSSLAGIGRRAEALDVLMTEAEPLRSKIGLGEGMRLDLRIGHRLLELNRFAEARTRFERAVPIATSTGQPLDLLDALTSEGRCDWGLGLADSARAVLGRALGVWEAQRRVPSNPEWRERRGDLGEALAFALIRATLGDGAHPPAAAVRATYDLVQRFKTRTLLERMSGPYAPHEGIRAPVTADELQSRVLGESELLLDAFVGKHEAVLFGVTRGDLVLLPLPPADSLAGAVTLYRDLLATASADDDPTLAALRARAANRLSAVLLGGAAELMSHARRVIVASDGPLNVIPLGVLPPPAGAGGGERLFDRHDVSTVPSATLLAVLRSRVGSAPERPLLAIGGRVDDGGRALPGAVSETRAIGEDIAGAEVRIVGSAIGSAGGDPVTVAELNRYRVLHVAAHTTVSDQRPWNSGILLGAAGAGDPYLRAATIAAMRLPARLAVLSGCASGQGRIAWGEGVEGLSASFLSAGVPVVLATLWPVDDAVSAVLMRAFYSHLSRGETVVQALRSAQLEVARRPGTAHPFFWAGYTVLGDGGQRIPLRRRVHAELLLLPVGAALLLVALASWRSRKLPPARAEAV